MAGFQWKEAVKESKIRRYKKHQYVLRSFDGGNYQRLALIEQIVGENRIRLMEPVDVYDDEAFIEVAAKQLGMKPFDTKQLPLADLLLAWGDAMVLQHVKKCDRCKESVYGVEITDEDRKEPEFEKVKHICSSCRNALFTEMFERQDADRNEEDDVLKRQYEANPPEIVGPFRTEDEATRYIESLTNEDSEEAGDGFIIAKGIVKSKDGGFYPAFLCICIQDAGEFYGANFIANNYDEVIPQHLVQPYLKDTLIPYEYKTIQYIPEDRHQDAWPNFT